MWSNDYIGIPYKLHGREIEEGLDCWGLVRQVYRRELGIELPSYADEYTTSVDGEGFQGAKGVEETEWQKVSTPREFDAVWCKIAGIECHTGIFLASGRMLHAMMGNDSCIVNLSTIGWERRVVQCYRHH
jgi:cell wall-associated NlpC family hydrolase